MCRMIAAVGRFEPAAVRRGFLTMTSNENPAHDHEHRAEGIAFQHVDGWGAAWVEGTALRVLRRTVSALSDDVAERIDPLETGLLVLHARKASVAGSVALENTHPFPVSFGGHEWAFCHNGVARDLERLQPAPGMTPAGGGDTERLFHHFLGEFARRAGAAAVIGERPVAGEPAAAEKGAAVGEVAGDSPAFGTAVVAALAATIAAPRDFTALHCLVASNDRVVAAACRHPGHSLADYHALWLGEGADVRVVSSEPVEGLGCTWTKIPEPGILTLMLDETTGG
jgi:predicted glutamine amidotransferase